MVVSRGESVGKEVLDAMRAVRASLPTFHADLAARHGAAVAALANVLARVPETREARPELVEPLSRVFVGSVRTELEQLADEVSGSLHAKCAHLDRPSTPAMEELARQRARWGRDARVALEAVASYVAGWVEGGGLCWSMNAVPRDVSSLRTEITARTTFVEQQARVAIDRWLQRAESDASTDVVQPAAQAPAAASPKERLAELLEKAKELGVRIRNVPDKPSERYLEKLAVQLAEVEQKRAASQAAAPSEERERLDALMAFADQLKVRVKSVPANPSATWIAKMEGKLVEVAERRGVPLPPSLRPSSPEETTGTPAQAPERVELGATIETALPAVDEERRARVESLLERAAETGLELGRVPPDPTDAWIAETEAKLEAAIERRKAERRAERKRREAERQARVEWIREQSEALGVDIGAIPAFPTDDWLARIEIRLQSTAHAPAGDVAVGDSGRAERLRMLLESAEEAGVDLGEIPPDPDDVWLGWAESLVDKSVDHDVAIPLQSEGFDLPSGFLIYEEGTVQEQVYAITESDELSIGRGRGNTIQIRDDAGVSRKHCTIRVERGRYWLRDEGSTKGTFVNGIQHVEIELTGDERLQCGETQFVFRMR